MATAKDLDGKIAVITGANSGIGLEAAVQLAQRGATIVMCCRNEKKAQEAREDVVKRGRADPSKVHIVQLDLSDLDNIDTFRSRYDAIPDLAGKPVHMLILNAGVMALAERELTKQGIEMQLGTNIVGHFKFTAVMIDLCKSADHSRVVSVSSVMHHFAKKIHFSDFNRENKYSPWGVYCESKLADFLFVVKLNRILEEKGINNIVAVACHPGYSATNLQQNTFFKFLNMFAQSAEMGAKPTVLAATDANAKRNGYAGPYFGYLGSASWDARANSAVWDQELQDKLWEKCEELTKSNLASRFVIFTDFYISLGHAAEKDRPSSAL